MADNGTLEQWGNQWLRESWTGTGDLQELGGGGNADDDGDRDPIEREGGGYHGIVGPATPVKGGNK